MKVILLKGLDGKYVIIRYKLMEYRFRTITVTHGMQLQNNFKKFKERMKKVIKEKEREETEKINR